MALADHLRELRSRLVRSVLAIVVFTIAAAFFNQHLMAFLLAPLPNCGVGGLSVHGRACAVVSTIGLLTPFTLALKVSLTAGVVAASPVWLYQVWAFVAPGLHRHERRYSLGFILSGVPLFLAGASVAYLVMPTTARMLISLAPSHTVQIMPAEDYLDVVTRMVLVFGLAFELPLLLVMLNFGGVVSGRRLLGWWRGMVMGITVFAAFTAPSPDPLSMLALAAPIWALYFIAVAIALFNDRRRLRNNPDAGLADDEASRLDLSVESVDGVGSTGAVEPVSASPGPVPTSRPEPAERVDDDIT